MDIEKKALELVNAERRVPTGTDEAIRFYGVAWNALCRAIEAHEADNARHAAEMEAFRREVSEAAAKVKAHLHKENPAWAILSRFIIPQPTASADAEPAFWLYQRPKPWPRVERYTSPERLPTRLSNGWTETPLYAEAQMQARADAARREALEPVRRWRDNLKITQGSPIVGDDLHGPALDFVIECLDGLLKGNPNAG